MSASLLSPRPSSQALRSPGLPAHGYYYDPAQSFAYTSAYSGGGAGGAASTLRGASTLSGELREGVLTKDSILDGLSELGRTADGTMVAYLTLNLADHGVGDVSLLTSYSHIQKLNLSYNSLTDLTPLGNLLYLTHLDVSYNKLSIILDFQPPENLMVVNYSHNEIEEMCDLSAHTSLTSLYLDCNQITEISGVTGLTQLTHLSLASNRIEKVANLDRLPLKYLNLSGNNIKVIENLQSLTQLQVLDMSGNQISSLRGLEGHYFLTEVNMEENEVVNITEVDHLKDLSLLKSLNLSKNPMEALADYRPSVLFGLPSLMLLDMTKVTVEEKVAAQNRFSPPPELVASQDHRTNIAQAAHKPARLRFSTLTRVDEPYPMLVLCGPPGSGKGHFAKQLVEEFPNFFGLGVSHTTRPQRPKESHGRDYYFIDEPTFDRASKSGEFIQTFKKVGYSYGLTMAAVEQVAQQGLACVTHMSIEGVLTFKNTHFEPRYILTIPLTAQIHEQRLKAKGCYADVDIKQAVQDVHHYKWLHQERPGFFDTAINTDSLREGYYSLRALVMAYGDITPESPFSLTSASQQTTQQTTTSITTSERTTPQPGTCTPSMLLADQSELTTESDIAALKAQQKIQGVAKSWSRPSSSIPGSRSVSGSEIQRKQGAVTPASGSRRQRQVLAAVAGKASISYEESIGSESRPGTRLSTLPVEKLEEHLEGSGEDGGELEEYSSEESSDDSEQLFSGSSLSKLSSERGFSPEHPSPPHSLY